MSTNFWTMVTAIVALATAVAGGITYIITNRPNRKHLAIIVAVTASIVLVAVILYEITDGQIPFFRASNATPNASPTLIVTATLEPSPTLNTVTPVASNFAFDFENGAQGWGTSEGSFKLARVDVVTSPIHSGRNALQITTSLLGDANAAYSSTKEVYRHTEATVYFSQVTPNGFTTPGPYNLSRKQVSCFVYLPSGLATNGDHQTYIRVFVKDTKFANDFSTAVNIDPSVVNKWIQLTFVVGADPNNAFSNFDPTKVNALGIRVETPDGSTMSYTGPFYIDDCSIQHP